MEIKMLFVDEKATENVHFGHFRWLSAPNTAFKQANERLTSSLSSMTCRPTWSRCNRLCI